MVSAGKACHREPSDVRLHSDDGGRIFRADIRSARAFHNNYNVHTSIYIYFIHYIRHVDTHTFVYRQFRCVHLHIITPIRIYIYIFTCIHERRFLMYMHVCAHICLSSHCMYYTCIYNVHELLMILNHGRVAGR